MSRRSEASGAAGRQVFSATPGAGPGDFDADSLSSIPSDFTPWAGGPKAPVPVSINRNKTVVKNKRRTQPGTSPSPTGKSKSSSKSSSKSTSKSTSKPSSKSAKTPGRSQSRGSTGKVKKVQEIRYTKAQPVSSAKHPNSSSASPNLQSPTPRSTDPSCSSKSRQGSSKSGRSSGNNSIQSLGQTAGPNNNQTKGKTSNKGKECAKIRTSSSAKAQTKKASIDTHKITEIRKTSQVMEHVNSPEKLWRKSSGQLSSRQGGRPKEDKTPEKKTTKNNPESLNPCPIESQTENRNSIEQVKLVKEVRP